jgi:hypothetical protein
MVTSGYRRLAMIWVLFSFSPLSLSSAVSRGGTGLFLMYPGKDISRSYSSRGMESSSFIPGTISWFTGDLQMKKTSSKNKSADIDDFRMLLKEQVVEYFGSGDGQDNLKVIVRGIVRDEIYGNEPEPGSYKGDASTATRVLIRQLIREELYVGDGK